MHHGTPQARETKVWRDVLSHADGHGSRRAPSLQDWRCAAFGCGLMIALVCTAGCSGDDNSATGTGGSGGAGGTGMGASGGGGSGPQDAGDMDGFVTCPQPGDPLDMYHANLVKTGSDGVLTFTLVESNNVPPSRGDNAWQLKITKKDQSPVTGELLPEIKMPHHTHPPSKAPNITYDAAKGLYNVAPVNFFMAGYWSARFDAYEQSSDAGAPLDRGTFYFCID